VDWSAADGIAVQLVLLVISPSEMGPEAHLERVARAVAITRLQRNRQKLLEAEDARALDAILREVGS
jgi:mannitol/fructose-specific phosphotransferase system IIA component (Ntr-type)